eukprot:COSAG01_NODE_3528_length_5967_cov_14.678255_10_plen_140_part_00
MYYTIYHATHFLDKNKDGRQQPLSDKKIRDKAYTKLRVQQQPDGSIFIFTDGSHVAKDKAKTAEDLCGWGLTVHLADPAAGTGFGTCLLERWGPVRLDMTHAALHLIVAITIRGVVAVTLTTHGAIYINNEGATPPLRP